MQSRPTEAQVKEFWEWCGFKYQDQHPEGESNWGFTTYPDGHQENLLKFSIKPHPSIDLNNLFKYAVPKLNGKYKLVGTGGYHFANVWKDTISYAEIRDTDPALTLFWAIWEAIKGVKIER